ncbi:uncharacterized protein MONBRDRAFT_23961 [Monosiga brevicollis MX1]|uniref:Uncharacterized protein n=1 Tax=Monosiga brevicollis TaxID=81824 RepID=A9UVC6_MONBE|nr:uncharacterized protein MONBRDRAFT_23961 [Monosiga brevicollis MX1]EDQ91059.1 predicted protein [Monosiga brevicollis MX1]|eukprot:XP_001744356.1 hypothetical protein [Monosiga brevicollis MX1]
MVRGVSSYESCRLLPPHQTVHRLIRPYCSGQPLKLQLADTDELCVVSDAAFFPMDIASHPFCNPGSSTSPSLPPSLSDNPARPSTANMLCFHPIASLLVFTSAVLAVVTLVPHVPWFEIVDNNNHDNVRFEASLFEICDGSNNCEYQDFPFNDGDINQAEGLRIAAISGLVVASLFGVISSITYLCCVPGCGSTSNMLNFVGLLLADISLAILFADYDENPEDVTDQYFAAPNDEAELETGFYLIIAGAVLSFLAMCIGCGGFFHHRKNTAV